MKRKYFLSTLLTGLILLSGCSDSADTNSAGKLVTFDIPIDKKNLSPKGSLEVKVLNEAQIKITEKSAGCFVSFDVASKKETITCPSGVEYKAPAPEIMTFKISDIKNHVVVKSTSVKVGEKYVLSISGPSSDNCNTVSTSVEKTADSEQEKIKNLQWVSTLMAC